MTQSDFNKKERFENLLVTAKSRDLGISFLLNEFKRNKWNLNLKQAEEITEALSIDYQKLLQTALEMNLLNVDSRTKKAILKNKARDAQNLNQ